MPGRKDRHAVPPTSTTRVSVATWLASCSAASGDRTEDPSLLGSSASYYHCTSTGAAGRFGCGASKGVARAMSMLDDAVTAFPAADVAPSVDARGGTLRPALTAGAAAPRLTCTAYAAAPRLGLVS